MGVYLDAHTHSELWVGADHLLNSFESRSNATDQQVNTIDERDAEISSQNGGTKGKIRQRSSKIEHRNNEVVQGTRRKPNGWMSSDSSANANSVGIVHCFPLNDRIATSRFYRVDYRFIRPRHNFYTSVRDSDLRQSDQSFADIDGSFSDHSAKNVDRIIKSTAENDDVFYADRIFLFIQSIPVRPKSLLYPLQYSFNYSTKVVDSERKAQKT